MNGSKPWYLSNAIWANLLQILVGLASSFGLISTEVGATIVEQAPALIVTLATTVFGVWGLWGRVRATTKIGGS